MHELKNNWNSAYKKSARIVGDVIGKYHPPRRYSRLRYHRPYGARLLHALCANRRSGNFGSVDGLAAAMRYTEIRMEKISHEMLADIEEETVNFGPNS